MFLFICKQTLANNNEHIEKKIHIGAVDWRLSAYKHSGDWCIIYHLDGMLV